MSELISKALRGSFGDRFASHVSMPGDAGYNSATAIWPKPVGRIPRAVVHCLTPEDVQSAIRAAHDCDLPLSVRGGGHDWMGRALCDGIVIDLSRMNGIAISADGQSALVSGGARAADLLATIDPLGLAAVTGSTRAVGMAGLTLGGGYGPLIGRFGLALDNLLSAQVVLADGRIVLADAGHEAELFWALRGGGGNFGVVTAMRHRLHELVRHAYLSFVRGPGCARALCQHGVTRRTDGPDRLYRGPRRCSRGLRRADLVRAAGTGRTAASAVPRTWNAACRHVGDHDLWRFADCVRRAYREWAARIHADVLAARARQRQHRCLPPGRRGGCIAWMRDRHARL
jgi:FAD/FMN-containing dehydrogenase